MKENKMSKCLCYKCDFAMIRDYKRKSWRDDQIIYGLCIHCNWTNTDIVNGEESEKEFFLTEYLTEMTCNRFKESKK